MVSNYRDLIVWQKSMDLVLEVYRLSRHIPDEERFSLVDQMRRAAVSIPSNIAEGFGRESKAEFKRFLSISSGSRLELQTQLLICERLGYLHREQTRTAFLLTEEIGRMLHALKKSIHQTDAKPARRGTRPVDCQLSTVD